MANVDSASLLVGGVIGFVSAVVAPIILDPLKHFIFGPKLKLKFVENDKGFVTETKENVFSTGQVRDAFYIRVLAVNKGRQIASKCRPVFSKC